MVGLRVEMVTFQPEQQADQIALIHIVGLAEGMQEKQVRRTRKSQTLPFQQQTLANYTAKLYPHTSLHFTQPCSPGFSKECSGFVV